MEMTLQQGTSKSRAEEAEASVRPGEFDIEAIASSLSATSSDLQELASEAIEDTKAAVQSAAQRAAFQAQMLQRREARARWGDDILTHWPFVTHTVRLSHVNQGQVPFDSLVQASSKTGNAAHTLTCAPGSRQLIR